LVIIIPLSIVLSSLLLSEEQVKKIPFLLVISNMLSIGGLAIIFKLLKIDITKEDFLIKGRFLKIIKKYPIEEKVERFKSIFLNYVNEKKGIEMNLEDIKIPLKELESRSMEEVNLLAMERGKRFITILEERERVKMNNNNTNIINNLGNWIWEHKVQIILIMITAFGIYQIIRYMSAGTELKIMENQVDHANVTLDIAQNTHNAK
jgi:hypothetical protein